MQLKEKMNYSERYIQLDSLFSLGKDYHIEDSQVDIRFFFFRSNINARKNIFFLSEQDRRISENSFFAYPVFCPAGRTVSDNAILLLHGLNERRWKKYLTWAEYLCVQTGKPVILFPMAFHINRGPTWWSDPHKLQSSMEIRRGQFADESTISFANVALSYRLSENPDRFYLSGRQTLSDIVQLTQTIKKGYHPAFNPNTHIDIFSYSIGSFLSQTLLMSNPHKLFSNSRLFMFCGGSIFSSMAGISRNIMDKPSFEKLQDYYIHFFDKSSKIKGLRDKVFKAFNLMIAPDHAPKKREVVFRHLGDRIRGISLAKDIVIPYKGIEEAMGKEFTADRVELIDFPFHYSHENPFPTSKTNPSQLNDAFNRVFSSAANFLR